MAKRVAKGTRQTSNKAGVQSTAKKMDSSRHGTDTHPATRRKAGAFAEEGGRKTGPRQPGTASRKTGKGGALDKLRG